MASQLSVGKAELLDGSLRDELRALLIERGVLVVRDMPFTDDELRLLARQLGGMSPRSVFGTCDDGLMKIAPDPQQDRAWADLLAANRLWHVNGICQVVPPFAMMLRPIALAGSGGETEFANTYAAYEDLSDDAKALLDGLQVVHSLAAIMMQAAPEADIADIERWMGYPDRVHPLVWRHRSGRRSLALSASCSHLLGMHPADSRDLLSRLMIRAAQAPYVYRHEWREGDLVICDNTGTMHRARPFEPTGGRLLHRVTLDGEEPVGGASG